MSEVYPRVGDAVRTSIQLGDTVGMMINEHHLSERRPNTIGIVVGVVPGHGGDVWWVRHDIAGSTTSDAGDHVAAYSVTEMSRIEVLR